jgi:predicted nucleic acid-binding protein
MELSVTAVYDANILYPAPLRDLFIRLAQAGLVRAKWSETIHDEWLRNVLKDNPQLSPERLARTRTLMNEAVRDCLVTGYEDLIASLSLPDPDDRHVLAAAIRSGGNVIVTYNLTDFPAETLARFDIVAQHPDDFLVSLWKKAAALRSDSVTAPLHDDGHAKGLRRERGASNLHTARPGSAHRVWPDVSSARTQRPGGAKRRVPHGLSCHPPAIRV